MSFYKHTNDVSIDTIEDTLMICQLTLTRDTLMMFIFTLYKNVQIKRNNGNVD